MTDFEKQQQQLQNMLDKVTDHVKATAEKAEAEAKAQGELSAELKAQADKALADQSELKARMNVLEQLLAKGSEGTPAAQRSISQLVAESEDVAKLRNGMASRVRVNLERSLMNAIDSNAGTSAATNGSIVERDRLAGVVPMPRAKLTVRDILGKGRTNSNSIEYLREATYDNNAAAVLENPTNAKPRSKGTLTLENTPVVTIAHHERITKQALSDAAWLASFVETRLRYGLAQKEEQQLLLGSGASGQLNGLYTQATAFARPAGAATIATGRTLVDTLRQAILQAELNCYYADSIILNPVAFANIDLMKDKNDAYLFGNPFGAGIASLWGRALVESQTLAASQWLVGAFGTEAQLFDREDASVSFYEQNEDDVVRNMITVLAEQREALAVYHAGAFIKNA